MDNLKYQDYVDLGIYPALDKRGRMHFSKPNIDFIIDKYLKLKNQFEEFKKHSEAVENINYSQFSMAKASADYYEQECKSLKEQIRDIKDYNERRVRFEEINKGLRRECQRYKKECQELQQENARLKIYKQELINELCENIKEKAGDFSGYHICECGKKFDTTCVDYDDLCDIIEKIQKEFEK